MGFHIIIASSKGRPGSKWYDWKKQDPEDEAYSSGEEKMDTTEDVKEMPTDKKPAPTKEEVDKAWKGFKKKFNIKSDV